MRKRKFDDLKQGTKFRYRRKLFIKINCYNAIHLVTGTYLRYVFHPLRISVANIMVTPVKVRMTVV